MSLAIELSFCPDAKMIDQILKSMRKHLDKDTYSKTIERFILKTEELANR
jgi:hypothetical protein